MKRFIKYVIAFFLPLIVGGITLEILLQRIPNDYAYKSDYLDKNSRNINQLYLGNSHIFYGIDPTYLPEGSFNASHISQSLDYDLAILKKYENHWNSLKCIVIPIDYFSLFAQIDTGIESWRAKNYAIYYNMYNKADLSNYFEITSNRLNPNIMRLVRYYTKGQSDLSCSELGWGTTYNSKRNQNLFTTGKSSAERHTLKNSVAYRENVAALQSIIAFAEQKKIKIVLITSPAYQTYRDHLDADQMSLTLKTIDQITAGHENVKYYNLMRDPDFVASDFYDADHLNEIGAKKLTLKIGNLTKQ